MDLLALSLSLSGCFGMAVVISSEARTRARRDGYGRYFFSSLVSDTHCDRVLNGRGAHVIGFPGNIGRLGGAGALNEIGQVVGAIFDLEYLHLESFSRYARRLIAKCLAKVIDGFQLVMKPYHLR